jgi:hypothetical protein
VTGAATADDATPRVKSAALAAAANRLARVSFMVIFLHLAAQPW